MNSFDMEDDDRLCRLPESVLRLLKSGNLDSSLKILLAPRMQLQTIGLSEVEIRMVRATASRKHARFETASSCDANMAHGGLKFGCRSLDFIMKNGLSSGITEFFGKSGAGKSQICLQLSLMVQLPAARGGLEKGAVFISTENAFPSKRLFEMAQAFTNRYGDKNYLDNIFIELVHDSEDLLRCVISRLPNLMHRKLIGLIIIDSVAAIFRLESNTIDRANHMRKLAKELLIISRKYDCVVVCVNQVTAVVNTSDDDKSTPSLGLAWSNLVTTRIQVEKTNFNHTIGSIGPTGKILGTSVPIRKCSIVFAPDSPIASGTFIITSDGIVDVAA